MPRILLVEDDSELALQLKQWLEADHYVVDRADSTEEARRYLEFTDYDVIVLDWQLPGASGVQLCRELRSLGKRTSIMMLSGRNTTTDKITGLDVGADDYLSKPYSYDELAARLRTLLRRPVERESELIKVGDLVLNPLARQLFLGTSEIKLLRKEFDLIEVLMRNPQQAYSSAALLRLLWPNDNEPNPDVLFTCIRRLRKKIDKPGEPSLISLVHGLGYRMRV